MTELQIQFYNAKENNRHNLANEALSKWNNETQAQIGMLNAQSNQANAVSNRMNVGINQQNADSNLFNAQTNRINADTLYKNYLVNEMNANTNKFNADTNRLNYSVNKQNADTNAFKAQTDYLSYVLNTVNSEAQRELWSTQKEKNLADVAYTNATRQPMVEKLNSETWKNLTGGGSGGGSSLGGAAGKLLNYETYNAVDTFNTMANGTWSPLRSTSATQWFGSMMKDPLGTTVSFASLVKDSAKQSASNYENKKYSPTQMMQYPVSAITDMQNKYGYVH